MPVGLRGTTKPLTDVYDVALLDLDGVVYVGNSPVRGAPAALAAARQAGMRLAFVTNNASRTPQSVADRLSRMGVPATADEVTTSALAAAHALSERLAPGSAVLVVGGEGLREAVSGRGLKPIATAIDPEGSVPAAAVVQGFSPEVGWSALSEAVVAIRAGAWWLATNLDATIPSERGPLPGNGSLVNVLQFAFGFTPANTGKPDPAMHRESVERSGAHRPLVVGDRLDTDIAGAHNAGAPSLLVMSGVTDGPALLSATSDARPDFVSRDVEGLLTSAPAVHGSAAADPGGCGTGRFRVVVRPLAGGVADRGHDRPEADLVVSASAAPGHADDGVDDELDALRSVAAATWWWHDRHGRPPIIAAADEASRSALEPWGITATPA